MNEKLIFVRPWWGRMAATDLLFDVEREEVISAESVTDGSLAYRQYRESCPIHGCECIRKRYARTATPFARGAADPRSLEAGGRFLPGSCEGRTQPARCIVAVTRSRRVADDMLGPAGLCR